MLHGGGRSLSEEIRLEFVRLAGGRDARIVLMPSDSYQRGKDQNEMPLKQGESVAAYERRMADEYDRWIALRDQGRIADFQFLHSIIDEDPTDGRFYALLEQATGVWIPAHDQERIPRQFASDYPEKTSKFQLALRKVVARGGIVAGLSGGMACLPETMIAGTDDTADENGWQRARVGFGLALLRDVVVDQNFDAHTGRLERLADFLRNGPRLDRTERIPGIGTRTIGIGVEQGTALILRENSLRAIGEGAGHIFLKSNGDRTMTWRMLRAGDDELVLRPMLAGDWRERPAVIEQDADRNPFGMPEPNEKDRWGTVVLHGGNDTTDMIDSYPSLAGVARPRLVHCPASRESCRPRAGMMGDALMRHLESEFSEWRDLQTRKRVEELTFLTTDDAGDAHRVEFTAPLASANGLWFCGGDQRELARLFVDPWKPTRFQREVGEIVRRGGVVGGSSAGLAIMPDVMIEGGTPEEGGPAEAALSRGLGVLRHVLAEQHFDARAGRIERLTGLLRDHKRLANFAPTCNPRTLVGIAVEEDTALILQANRVRVAGTKLAHLFLQDQGPTTIVWHALKPGDVAALRATSRGLQLQPEEWRFAP